MASSNTSFGIKLIRDLIQIPNTMISLSKKKVSRSCPYQSMQVSPNRYHHVRTFQPKKKMTNCITKFQVGPPQDCQPEFCMGGEYFKANQWPSQKHRPLSALSSTQLHGLLSVTPWLSLSCTTKVPDGRVINTFIAKVTGSSRDNFMVMI